MGHSIEQSMLTAEISLRMEGLSVSDTCKDWCRKLLTGEITLEQYLSHVISGSEVR